VLPVLISCGSGSGRSEDEVLLASTLRLLSRGARPPVVALSSDVPRSVRAHPDLRFHPEERLAEALESCSALLIAGDLSRDTRLERAAVQVTLAKLANVPVALIAVRMPPRESMCEHDLCELLAQSESVSTSDAASARRLAECSGQRPHTAAPLELLMRIPRRPTEDPTRRIGVDEVALDGADPRFVQRLVHAASEEHLSVVVVAHDAAQNAPRRHVCPRRATENWSDWLQEIADCDFFIGNVNSMAVNVAAGQGVVPIALTGVERHAELHERLGLSDLVIPGSASDEHARAILQRAQSYDRESLCARAATLRTVAWRALGPLADTSRSRPLQIERFATGAHRVLAQALEERVRRAFDVGDFDFVARELARWKPELENESRWALAQAQYEILQGREPEARALLERAVESNATDTECRATLAMVLWRLGDGEGARQQWNRVAELEPQSARAPYQIGCLELLRGRMEQAMDAWDEARQRDPSHVASKRALADMEAPRVRDGAA